MVINAKKQVAMRYTISTNGKTVRIDGTPRYYVFTPKHNVPMAWVDQEDVARLLTVREKSCNCNNGTYKFAFEYCSLINVNMWMFSNRDGSPEADYQEVENG